jgi:hypothetical protein
MEQFYMFYGSQPYEFERSAIVAKTVTMELVGKKYSLALKTKDSGVAVKPSSAKVVLKG